MISTGGSRRLVTAALIVAATSIPIGAAAQDRVGLTFGAGGIFEPRQNHAQRLSEPVLIGSVQRVMKHYLVIEGDVSYWSHASRFDYGPHDVSGPSGVIGRVGHATVIDAEKNWTLGVNLLVRSTGVVRVF